MDNEDFEMEDEDLATETEEEGEEGDEEGDLADDEASATRLAEEAASGIAEAVAGGVGDVVRNAQQKEKVAEGINSVEANSELFKKFEKFEGKKISPEAFLSRTERMLLNSVHDAVTSGDLKSAQEMLATVAENPKSVKRVMDALKERLEGKFTGVSWESGTDNKGNAFVRLHISQFSPMHRESTRVMIGSDGTHSASVTAHRGGESPADPAAALADMYPQRHHRPDRWNNIRPIPEERIQPSDRFDQLRQLQERGYKPAVPSTPSERQRR